MLKKTTILLLLFCGLVLGRSSWSVSDYQRFNYQSFQRFKPAKQQINLRKIDYPLLHAAIFYETNRVRARLGYEPLKFAQPLERSAKQHSDDMVQHDFFSHTSPVSGRQTAHQRIKNQGVRFNFTAENIADIFGIEYENGEPVYTPKQNGGYFSYRHRGEPIPARTYLSLARSVVQGWMDSRGHRQNILHRDAIYLGVGAAHYKDSSFYNIDRFRITQNFGGRPLANSQAGHVSN